MQAILLATGEDQQLRPLTDTIPSPMLPVVDRPIMSYPVELIKRQEFSDILVNLYHLAGSVEAYFGTGHRYGMRFNYLLQRDAWGSAGAVKWAESSLHETFVVMPADRIVDCDLDAAVARHRARNSLVTVVVHEKANGSETYVCLDEEGRITPEGTVKRYNTGLYVMEPEVLEYIPTRTHFDLHQQLLPALVQAGFPVYAYEMEGYWNPVNTFENYYAAQRAFLNSAWGNPEMLNETPPIRFASLPGLQIADGIWVGRNNVIHPSVRLLPPIFIGSNCRIGREVELGPEAIVSDNVIVDDEATVNQSAVFDHTYVGQLVNVEKRFVNKNSMIDVATGQTTQVSDSFLLDEAAPSTVGLSFQKSLDKLIAFFLLVLLSPVFLFISLLVLVTSGRLFSQALYVGSQSNVLNPSRLPEPRSFSLYRFVTRREDGRYTPLGKLLERLEWHRLPELWNVVKGDMILIGVKPLLQAEAAQVVEVWQKKRFDAMAGFTGLWYIQSRRNSELDEMLIADAYYTAVRNWREDIKIFLKTPGAWLRRMK